MGTLPSGLQTIDSGTEGWNAVHSSNMQLLDNRLKSVIADGAQVLGSRTVTDASGAQSDPSTQQSESLTDSSGGSASSTIGAVSGSGADGTINDNFASLVAQHNKIVAEIANLITILVGTIEYSDANKAKINEILEGLRKLTGCGVFN